eukprot:8857269-Alexandrium_andersonii.AAC.1
MLSDERWLGEREREWAEREATQEGFLGERKALPVVLQSGQAAIRRLCAMPLARELPLLPGAEVTGPEVAEAGPSA